MDVRPVRRMAGTQHGDMARHPGKGAGRSTELRKWAPALDRILGEGKFHGAGEGRDHRLVHWHWRWRHQAIGRPLPFAADQDRGDPPVGRETERPTIAAVGRQRDRAVGRGILQQQRRPGLAIAFVATGVPDATVEQQRSAVLHVGLDDGRGWIDGPRNLEHVGIGDGVAALAQPSQHLLHRASELLRACHEQQAGLPGCIPDADPDRDHARVRRRALDVGVPRMAGTRFAANELRAPQNDFLAKERAKQGDQIAPGRDVVDHPVGYRVALRPIERRRQTRFIEMLPQRGAFVGRQQGNRPGASGLRDLRGNPALGSARPSLRQHCHGHTGATPNRSA